MVFLLGGGLSLLIAVAALWKFRARAGVSHPAMRGVFGGALPLIIVFLLVFSLCGIVAGMIKV